ncbi:uncharacterized protein LOC143021153 isoform X1 [Oratosquilla oratoria]|uniref:uncharacterized protein LOC143021153 isoform X1 n=1 Tax=Oratosquilla oratoria TaxID=337810 RepID=UPI003F760BE3
MAAHNFILFAVGAEFDSFAALKESISSWENYKNVNLYTRNSRTIQSATKRAPNRSFKPELQYFSIDYCCQHGGRKYQPKSTTGTRPNQMTLLKNCPFHIQVRASEDGQRLIVTHIDSDDVHSHDIKNEIFKYSSKQRKLSSGEVAEIKAMINLKANRKLITEHLIPSTGASCTTKSIMPVQWKREAEVLLIEEVRAIPLLWDTKHKDYPKKLLRKQHYKNISEELQVAFPDMEGIDADAVMNKFNILKSSFHQELAKVKQIKSTGGDYTPKWKLFGLLCFLNDEVMLRSEEDSATSDSGQECLGAKVSDMIGSDEESTSSQVNGIQDFKMYKNALPKNRRNAIQADDHCIAESCVHMKNNVNCNLRRDEFDIFGEHIAARLRNISQDQVRLTAQHQIHSALFEAEMSKFKSSSSLSIAKGQSDLPTIAQNEGDCYISEDVRLARKRKEDCHQCIFSQNCECSAKKKTYFIILAKSWAHELEMMDPVQQIFAKKAIDEIMLEGQLGTLHRHSLQINVQESPNLDISKSSPSTSDVNVDIKDCF